VLLRRWKTSTQQHRALEVDDAKALRMIEAAFKRGEDFEEDLETHFF